MEKKRANVIEGGPNSEGMWKPCKVTLHFVGKLCGSVPANEDVVKSWLEARKPGVKPPSGKSITEVAEEVINRIPDINEENLELEKRSTIVFEQVDGKLVLRAATVRSHLKDSVNQVQNQFVGRIKGERNFTTRIKNGLYIGGGYRDESGTEVLFIMKDGKPVTKPDGFQERMVHAKSPSGPVNALKRFAYVLRPTVQFTAYLLGNSVTSEDLGMILKYGATHGYGGERSMQEGQYTYRVEVGEADEKLVKAA